VRHAASLDSSFRWNDQTDDDKHNMPSEPDGSIVTLPPSHFSNGQGAKTDKAGPDSPLQLLSRWVRQAWQHKNGGTLKEALEEVLQEHAGGEVAISSEERNLLRNMIAFGELKVGDVMIPRTDISAVPETIGLEDLKTHVATHRHTRIPIYADSLDNVTGFLHIKDFFFCLMENREVDVKSLKRTILFVPPSMKIIDLLLKMRLSSCHMAIVIDEYGGTDGLVTMEDLFEEIVGEIQDEHDEDEELPAWHWISDKALEADARVKVEDLAQELQLELVGEEEDEDYDTLGGLIFSHLGRIPAKGEVVDYNHGIKIEILSADPRRIKKVRVVRPEPLPQMVDA
jgi:magnesium and cobalt transporter